MDYTALAAILTAAAALIGVFYNAAKQKRESENATKQYSLSAKSYELEALRSTVNELSEENHRLRELLKDFDAKVDSKTRRIGDLENQVTVIEVENKKFSAEIQELSAQLDSKTKRIQDLESQVATLEAQVKELGATPRKARRGTGPLGA